MIKFTKSSSGGSPRLRSSKAQAAAFAGALRVARFSELASDRASFDFFKPEFGQTSVRIQENLEELVLNYY